MNKNITIYRVYREHKKKGKADEKFLTNIVFTDIVEVNRYCQHLNSYNTDPKISFHWELEDLIFVKKADDLISDTSVDTLLIKPERKEDKKQEEQSQQTYIYRIME